MRSAIIHHFSARPRAFGLLRRKVFAPSRVTSVSLVHLAVMNSEQLSGLGLEPMVTTSELAEYLRVDVQAIYDLRLHDRGPKGVRVGRELRFRISDVKRWLDGMHEPEAQPAIAGGDL
jgi:excisionase family DNA binding protein